MPVVRAELRVPVLLPRIATRIVCVDDGDGDGRGLAERLAEYLAGQGATDLHVLDGGTGAWEAAGFVLFSGVNVPSKAFGEWVEHHFGTESIDAPELKAWIDDGRDMVVLDSRPLDEFRRMSIPTGINVPGGELAYRIGDLAPDPATLIVVNCAGRTRSINGCREPAPRRGAEPGRGAAQRHDGLGIGRPAVRARPDPAVSSGSAPQRPPWRSGVPAPSPKRRVSGVIGSLDLERYADDPDRTLYVLDVRDPAGFAGAHRPGSRNAPGGQLIQATDQWIAVRGARIALLDDDGVRARMAGAWLRQMGCRDVFVVEGGLLDLDPADAVAPPLPEAELVAASDLDGALIVDLARSIDFRAGHIPGAIWGIRTRLDALRDRLARAKRVVATSPEGILARLAVAELQGLTSAPVQVLQGGTAAWVAAGNALAVDRADPPDAACADFYLRPYDRNSGVEAAMQDYLSWEINLVHEIERDGTVAFGA